MKISQIVGSTVFASAIAATAFSSPLGASAASFSFGFDNIYKSSGSPADDQNGVTDSIVDQFSFTVTDGATAGTTLWTFNNKATNTSSVASFIGQIYFDWTSTALGINKLNATGTSAGVDFNNGANPSNLPQGNNLSFAANLALGADNPAPKNGVNLGETLAIIFNSTNATALKAAIDSGDLRVGIHVQGIKLNSKDYSDAFVSSTASTKPVPVPGFVLGIMAAGAFGGSRLLKNKKQTA